MSKKPSRAYRVEKALLSNAIYLEMLMSVVSDLLEATKANTDATNSIILLIHGLVDRVAELNAAGDVTGVADALVEIKANTAQLIAATTENTPHESVLPSVDELQAAVDAMAVVE